MRRGRAFAERRTGFQIRLGRAAGRRPLFGRIAPTPENPLCWPARLSRMAAALYPVVVKVPGAMLVGRTLVLGARAVIALRRIDE